MWCGRCLWILNHLISLVHLAVHDSHLSWYSISAQGALKCERRSNLAPPSSLPSSSHLASHFATAPFKYEAGKPTRHDNRQGCSVCLLQYAMLCTLCTSFRTLCDGVDRVTY